MPRARKRPWRLDHCNGPGNYHAFEESLWDDAEKPCCGICGLLIEKDPNAKEFFSQVPGFTPRDGNKNYIRLSNAQIHEYLAVGKCNWKSTYRAVVTRGPTHEPFLSGVTYRHSGFKQKGGYHIGVPRNADDVFLIRNAIHPREIFWFGKISINANDDVEPGNIGWPIHECCWQLLTRCWAGERYLKRHLAQLLCTLHMEHFTKANDFYNYGPPSNRSQAWNVANYDPLYITNYYEAMERALQKFQRDLSNRTNRPNDEYRGVRAQMGFHISGGSFHKIPLDIAFMITDYLDGRDFRNLILAARWKFPSIYWRRMIPKCVFELHEDLFDRGLDWQSVGLDFHRMMEKKDGVWHRITIMHYMARIWSYMDPDVTPIQGRFMPLL